jgi:murein DD-endopeptidase MepM/ murein hydrolase activator NlpD
VTDDNSFDPRTWGKDVARPAAAGASAPALPEAWRAVAETASTPAVSPSVATRTPNPPRNVAPLIPYAVSVAILVTGAGVAWLSRAPQVAVAPPPVEQPVAAAEAPAASVSVRRLVLASVADLRGALVAAGIAAPEADAASKAAMGALTGTGEVRAALGLRQEGGTTSLDRLEASFADGSGAVVSRDASGNFVASRVAAELTKQIRAISGELDADSFYSSAVSAGLTDSLIPEFINAFAFDFNLAAEVSPGDTFEVAYETTVNAAGEPVGQPQLVYAALTTPTKSRALYRFKPEGEGEFGWYDGNGASTVRSFMRTPVDGARITSKFGPRFHPVLRYTRLHGGTDFAAPVGTPIYSAADGVVVSASPSRCAGNMVVIRHDNGWETRYFHLSRYADGVAAGFRVKQGFTVGDVGNTGTCTTGPHLHYEVHIDGQKVDPLSIKTESGKKGLEGAILAAFRQARDRVDVARAQQVR